MRSRANSLFVLCLSCLVFTSFAAAEPVPIYFMYEFSEATAYSEVFVYGDIPDGAIDGPYWGSPEVYALAYAEALIEIAPDEFEIFQGETETYAGIGYWEDYMNNTFVALYSDIGFMGGSDSYYGSDHYGEGQAGLLGSLEVGTSDLYQPGSAGLAMEIYLHVEDYWLMDQDAYITLFSDDQANPIDITLDWNDSDIITTIPVLAGQGILVEVFNYAEADGYGMIDAYSGITAQINIVEIPEPATIFILGAGSLFLLRKKK